MKTESKSAETQPLFGQNPSLASLEKVVAGACFCKLRSKCTDKTSVDCLKHRNLYAEFMHSKAVHQK